MICFYSGILKNLGRLGTMEMGSKCPELAQVCGVPVDWRSGGRLATTLVATINVIIAKLS